MMSYMALKAAFLACLIIYMTSGSSAQVFDVAKYGIMDDGKMDNSKVFDLTKYGAVDDGKLDNSKALLDAWNAACAYEGEASLVIPRGTFVLGPVKLAGPCFKDLQMKVEIQGTLKALPSLSDYPEDFWIEFRAVKGLIIGGGGTLDGHGGAEAWRITKCPHQTKCKNMPTTLRLSAVTDAMVSDLTLMDSKGFHMKVQRSVFVAVHHLKILAPENSPNTDGIHISGTNHINVTDLTISTGDDCISIGPGAIFVSISNVKCGPGHGISIGSLGKYKNEKDVSMVKVTNCTLTNTDNGIRIKTWPGSPPSVASHFTFEDIIMNNVANPIIIDQEYCPVHHCSDEPSRVRIHDVTFRNIRGTTDDAVPVSLVCSKAMPCEDVHLEGIHLERITKNGNTTITAACSNVVGSALGVQIPHFCLETA